MMRWGRQHERATYTQALTDAIAGLEHACVVLAGPLARDVNPEERSPCPEGRSQTWNFAGRL